ncbi:MAG: cation:proton antiporter [Rhodospirillales bacterium CG15_BIG_FIL_POST_REV_8_21_14_020_66_15]|nr:MAG: cation:proton antiporter [Rhodospirillales bacterium CG15_BIG_FIL_POST_REV_8_21_14_020_66_15]
MSGLLAGLQPAELMQLTVIVPVVGAFAILALGRWENLRDAASLLTASCLFYVVYRLYPVVAAGGRPDLVLMDMVPGLSIRLTLEPLGMIFAGIASFLWIVTTLYAIGYMRGHHEENQTRFYFFFAIAIASAMGVAMSGNMLTLFVFYEVLSVSTYPLVAHHGTDEAKRGARVYLSILLTTSIVFLLMGMIWTFTLTGNLDFVKGGIFKPDQLQDPLAGILLALYAFGIGKAALMPFHRWLPAAMVAPTPVSALLHAVAVVKAGVFSVLKVAVYVFGLDLMAATPSADVMLYVAAFTMIAASLVAMRQDNLKRRLAYSTVSQLSYIVVGAFLAHPDAAVGGAMHIATHAFGKITLFFCAGAILVASHKTEISQMRGLGRKMPVTFICFMLGSLSIIGLPPFAGMWSKWYLALGAASTHEYIVVAAFMLSSLLNVAYLLPIAIRGFYSNPGPEPANAHGDDGHGNGHDDAHHVPSTVSFGISGIEEAPLFSLAAICVTTAGCVVLFFYPDALFQLASQLVAP